ncbi:MAG TPA: hypothetical protein VGK38_10410, partial [Prolixibacteraceae bacterium]
PLIILSVLSVFGGFLNIPSLFGGDSNFATYLQSAVSSIASAEMSPSTEIGLIIISLILLGLIILLAYRIFVRKAVLPAGDEKLIPFFGRIAYNKFYIDDIYTAIFERPFGLLSDFFFNKVENTILDPAVDEIGSATSRLGTLVRRLQPGNMSFYLFAMVAGILLFIVFILII